MDRLGIIVPRLVMVSGGFDPVHKGHVRLFNEAKNLGSHLVVVLNCDDWLLRKKGKFFMSGIERAEIISNFSAVDFVYVLETSEDHVCEALEQLRPAVFANGGDRKSDNIPEYEVCEKLGIEMAFEVGGGKVQSSSWLHSAYQESKEAIE